MAVIRASPLSQQYNVQGTEEQNKHCTIKIFKPNSGWFCTWLFFFFLVKRTSLLKRNKHQKAEVKQQKEVQYKIPSSQKVPSPQKILLS